MFNWGHFVNGVIGLVISLLNIYSIVILIRIIASWLGADPYNPIIQFLSRLTDPVFDVVRRRLPSALWRTGLDFSPLVAILFIQVVILLLESIRL